VNCPIAVLSALAYDPLFRARTLGCEASLAQPCQSRGASGRLQRISDFTKAILIRVAEGSQSPYQTKWFGAPQEATKTDRHSHHFLPFCRSSLERTLSITLYYAPSTRAEREALHRSYTERAAAPS
jgi:hypothetical protein